MTDIPTFDGKESDFGPEFGRPVPPNFQVDTDPDIEDTFPDPYENRESIARHVFEVPAPLDADKYTVLDRFKGPRNDQEYALVVFREGEELPIEVAEWIHHRTFTDGRILAQTDDGFRFDNPEVIAQRFLKDKLGRRLYPLINLNSGKLSVDFWIHALVEGVRGAMFVDACDVHNARLADLEGSKESDKLNPAKMGTAGSRVYSEERQMGLHGQVVVRAVPEYYASHPHCEGIIVRISSSDVQANDAFKESATLKKHDIRFEPVHTAIEGVTYLVNRRPGLDKDEPEPDPHGYDPRPHRDFNS